MKIFINGEYRDFTLEEEQELQDIYKEVKEFDENKIYRPEEVE
jgi:hypothetical protein